VSVAHVCAAAVAGVGADGAAVTVVVNSTVRDTVHATDRVAGELEEWQLAFGQGPCVDAFAAGGPVLVMDLGLPGYSARWPAFTPAALGSGARALFALPMWIGAVRLGVLDLYRARPGALSALELSNALAFADAAGMLLLDGAATSRPDSDELAWHRDNRQRDRGRDEWQHDDRPHHDQQRDDGQRDDRQRDDSLHGEWRHRDGEGDDPTEHQAQVHQATGMILAQLGVSAETAFARLRAYGYAHERRLGDVARDVVERRLRFDPDPPPSGNDEGERT
jgi:ANTAR domain